MLLAIAAAVGAGYVPAADPLRMMDPVNVDSLVSSVRSQHHAARQWLDQVARHFGHHNHQQSVSNTACFGELVTTLPNIHRYPDAHVHRCLIIDHTQQVFDGLLNLPPPMNV